MITFKNDFTKSELFQALNKSRAAIRAKGVNIDKGRLNRAFGMVQAKNCIRPYKTTVRECNCQDSRNGHICKHRIALTILHYAGKIRNGTL